MPARRPVLGVPDGSYLADLFPDAAAAFDDALRALASSWYEVRHVAMPWADDLDAIYASARALVEAELAARHEADLARSPALVGARVAAAILRGRTVADAEVRAHRAGRITLRTALERAMDRTGVDLWLGPSTVGAAPAGLGVSGFGGTTVPWAYAGLPAVTLPVSVSSEGLPLGLQCVGRFGDDEHLLAWAARMDELLRGNQAATTVPPPVG